MSDNVSSIARFVPTQKYSIFAWVFVLLFIVAAGLGIDFGNLYATAIAAYFAKITNWKDVYLMSGIGWILMVILLIGLAIAMGRWSLLASDVPRNPLFFIRSGVFHYLGMAVASTMALYVGAYTGRSR